jgi:DNA polymerase theta
LHNLLLLLLLVCCSGGEQSTSSEVLQALAAQHALPGIILQHRKLHKLKTGFMNSLGAKLAELQQQQQRALASDSNCYNAAQGGAAAAVVPAGPCALLDEGCSAVTSDSSSSSSSIVRIRGSFLQTNTATGRLSMDDPALQTIPRPVDFQLELPAAVSQHKTGSQLSPAAAGGAVQLQQVQVNVRASFVAPPGWTLLSADYSQIELRLVRLAAVPGTACCLCWQHRLGMFLHCNTCRQHDDW